MEVNIVIQSGIVRYPALRYDAKGKPEFRFTLSRTANGFTTSIPCCSVGSAAERLAGELDEGMAVLISAGELVYRKRSTKDGERSRLEILVWRASVAQVDSSAVGAIPGQGDASDGA